MCYNVLTLSEATPKAANLRYTGTKHNGVRSNSKWRVIHNTQI